MCTSRTTARSSTCWATASPCCASPNTMSPDSWTPQLRAAFPLDVVDIRDDHARALYERDLVLIRPDQHVAWRGNAAPTDPLPIVDRIRGAHA
ncbi:aromatic-ring hydroxylase C-terminal domain-containing protein [Nocardia vinacea]|uniref:aromatic-ring hydroxylase C-terminal domain-containing protein n=1 Tax=Nocardia vinacea TaxID=96468 RepID=UPI003570D0E0